MLTNKIFMLFLLPIGFLLFSMVTWIEYNLPNSFVPSEKYKASIKTLFVISTAMIIAPIIYAIENKAFSGCIIQSNEVNIIYIVSTLTLGLIILSCGSIIKDEISRDSNLPAWGIMAIGIVCMVLCFFYLIYMVYTNIIKNKDGSQPRMGMKRKPFDLNEIRDMFNESRAKRGLKLLGPEDKLDIPPISTKKYSDQEMFEDYLKLQNQ